MDAVFILCVLHKKVIECLKNPKTERVVVNVLNTPNTCGFMFLKNIRCVRDVYLYAWFSECY